VTVFGFPARPFGRSSPRESPTRRPAGRAAHPGDDTAQTYEGAGISGASVANRPALQSLIRDAGKFEIVVTGSLDRLSRSQADIAIRYERLSFLGVRVETLVLAHVTVPPKAANQK